MEFAHVHRGDDCIIVDNHGDLIPWWKPFYLRWQILDDPDLTSHAGQLGKLQIMLCIGKTRIFWVINGNQEVLQ
jgi:hypothetical protein